MKLQTNSEINELGKVLLQISTLLMSNGASTSRIRMTVDRISHTFGYNADMLITHRVITLSLSDNENNQLYHNQKRGLPHAVNFKLVSGISRMSWKIVRQDWSIDDIKLDLKRLLALPHYPRIIVLTFVSLAGASFCRLAGGDYLEMIIAFVATFAGLFARQEALKKKFNPYIGVLVGSTVSTLVAGSFSLIGGGFPFEHGFATSVLYLIPGIPLINSFTDLIDGNTLNGLLRWAHGLIIAFMIALGLTISIYIYHI